MSEIISVVVGGALAIAGGVIATTLEHRRERKALAYALAGEIKAIVDIVERRKYHEFINQMIEVIEKTRQPDFIRIRIEQNYFVVYEANAMKVGLLPRDAAHDVARFYTYAKSIIEDVTDDRFSPQTDVEALQRLKGLQDLIGRLVSLGNKVAQELEKI